MTTSGSYSFTVNRDQIIRMSLLILGKLDESEVPSAQEVTDCSIFLNMLLKQWQGKADFAPGLKTFTRRHGHLFLQPTTGKYMVGPAAQGWTNNYVQSALTVTAAAAATSLTLNSVSGMLPADNIGIILDSEVIYWTTVSTIVGNVVTIPAPGLPSQASANNWVYDYTTTAQQPIVIETCFLRDNTLSDTPMNMMTAQQYDFLPNKAQMTNISDPTAIYYEQQKTNSYLYIDAAGAQDMTKHLCLTYMEPVQDMNAPDNEFCYPQEWFLAIAYGLAKMVSPIFTVQWSQVMEENASVSLAIAQKKEPEMGTMYFQCGADL